MLSSQHSGTMRDSRFIWESGMSFEADIQAAIKSGFRILIVSCLYLRRRFVIPVFVGLLLCSLCLQSLRQTSHVSRSLSRGRQEISSSVINPFRAREIRKSLHNQIAGEAVLHVREDVDLDHGSMRSDTTSEAKSESEDTNNSKGNLGAARVSRLRPDARIIPNARWTPHVRSRMFERIVAPLSQTSHRHSFDPPNEDSPDPLPSTLNPRMRGSSQVSTARRLQQLQTAQESSSLAAEDAFIEAGGVGGIVGLDVESELQHMGRSYRRLDLEPYSEMARVPAGSLGLEIEGSTMEFESIFGKAMVDLNPLDFESLPASLGRRCACAGNSSVTAVTAGCVQTEAGSSLHAAEEIFQVGRMSPHTK